MKSENDLKKSMYWKELSLRLLMALFFNTLLFVPESMYRLCKGVAAFVVSPTRYLQGLTKLSLRKDEDINPLKPTLNDRYGKRYLFTAGFSRVFAVAATVICILGFVGALAVPLPGIAPLYTASIIGIAKAVGITIGWSIVARLGGSLLGSVADFFRIRSVALNALNTLKSKAPGETVAPANSETAKNKRSSSKSQSFSSRQSVRTSNSESLRSGNSEELARTAVVEMLPTYSSAKIIKRLLVGGLTTGILGEVIYPIVNEQMSSSKPLIDESKSNSLSSESGYFPSAHQASDSEDSSSENPSYEPTSPANGSRGSR
jgi:hypothetical protein